MTALIRNIAPDVHAEIIRAAGRSNVSEFAKRPACWEVVQRLHTSLGRTQRQTELPCKVIDIHALYGGVRIDAAFDQSTRSVTIVSGALAGERYETPSGAAVAIVSHHRPDVDPSRNGWLFWSVSETGDPLSTVR